MPIQIEDLLRAANGEIVGKVRLQKTVYLLDQVGLESGFSYEYHHYGPYSAELARSVDDSVFLNEITEQVKRRVDGVPYSVFRLPERDTDKPTRMVGGLSTDQAAGAIKAMQGQDTTVLELASTIHWLTSVEGLKNWHKELVRRKGVKASESRIEKAVELLSQLGLPITSSP
jgi:uncharacterized protein YwgA